MKRFLRTQLKAELQGTNKNIKDEQEPQTYNIEDTSRGLEFIPQKLQFQQEIENKTVKHWTKQKISQTKFAFLMVERLIKSKKHMNLEYSIKKIIHKNQKQLTNKNKLFRALRISENFERSVKQFVLRNLTMNSSKYYLKMKFFSFLKSICNGIDRKLKSTAFLNIVNFCNKTVCEQNCFLKELQTKYEENNIPQQYAKQLRKFIKINPRNIKNFMKSSYDIAEPVIYALVEVLEQKRIKKSIQSNSQILVGITKNYVETLKDVNGKISCMQNEVKDLTNSKNEIEAELKDFTKESDMKMKEIKKYDLDLIQKSDSVQLNNFSAQSLKNLQRVIDNQIKICQGKIYNGYEYSSRAATLKNTSMVVKKLLYQLQIPAGQVNHSKRNHNRHVFTPKKNRNEIIEQQNSIQQSDIVEEIMSIVDDLIAQMRKQTSFEELRACLNEKKFSSTKKPMQTPQLINIYRKFGQIFGIFCESKFICLQIQNQSNEFKEKLNEQNMKLSSSLKQKTDNVLGLNEKINEMELSMCKINAAKIQSMSSFEKQITKRQKQLEEAIQGLSIKLEESLIEIETKDKQIDALTLRNLSKEKKLGEVKNEFKSFKKNMKNSMLKNKEREKSIDEILERSLSKSKISVNSGIFNRTFDSTVRKEKKAIEGTKLSKLFLNSPASPVESVLDQFSIDLSEKDDGKRNNLILGPIKETSSIKNLKNILENQDDIKNMNNKQINRDQVDFMKPKQDKLSDKQKLQQLQQKVNVPTQKLIESDGKVRQPSNIQQQFQFLPLQVLPENIIAMMYNIIIKIKELPQNSKLGQQTWGELLEICVQRNGIELLDSFEQYMVKWIDRNLDEISNKKMKTIAQTNDESCNQTPKRQSRSSSKNKKKIHELNKTIKQISSRRGLV